MQSVLDKLKKAQNIILSTHRHCDADGLGAEIALFHALKKAGKKPRILNVDETPRKFHFLEANRWVQFYEGSHEPIQKSDLALILDTNDARLVDPLFGDLLKNCRDVLFIDHHPVLRQGPEPTPGSWIDATAASTGELAFRLIKGLNIPLDRDIARALYASISFDTQVFRYVRSSPNSHLIAAELLKFVDDAENIHRNLFATYSVAKMLFLAKALSQIEYLANGQLAFLKLQTKDFEQFGIDLDDSRDVIDFLMNVETIQAAALLREDGNNHYKLSLRSKGRIEVSRIAEKVGGGGHWYSAGAYLTGKYEELRQTIVDLLMHSIQSDELQRKIVD